MTFDGKAFGIEVVAAVKEHVDRTVTPLQEHIKSLESRIKELEAAEKAQPAREFTDLLTKFTEEVASVRSAVEALESPKLEQEPERPDIEAMVTEAVQRAFASLPDPRDIKALFRAEGKNLIAVLSDGSTHDLGKFVGEDGQPGRDGLGFDDMRLEVRSEGVYMVWERGEVIKDAFVPTPFYRGVWSKDAGYRQGNTVTWGGSTWIAVKDSPQGKPDAPDSDWMLSNKRGKDGKGA